MKDKHISIRLSEAEHQAIFKAASNKKISPSAFVRSLLITAIENNFDIVPSASPSPNFDKLSFDARKAVLFPFDLAIFSFLQEGLTIQQAENAFLLAEALAGESIAHSSLKPSELKDKVNAFYQNRIAELTSEFDRIQK